MFLQMFLECAVLYCKGLAVLALEKKKKVEWLAK